MVQDFVSNMLNDNIELRKHCASAIFKCAQEEETRALGRLITIIIKGETRALGRLITIIMRRRTRALDRLATIIIRGEDQSPRQAGHNYDKGGGRPGP